MAGTDDWQSVNDWQDAPQASAPAPQADDWADVKDWQDAPEPAQHAEPIKAEAPPPVTDLLAQHMDAGTVSAEGRITPEGEIAAYREGTNWATRNIARPLERGVRNLGQGVAAGQLSKAQRELAALERLETGEKPDPAHMGEYRLFSLLPPDQRARIKAEKQRAIGVNAGLVVEHGAAAAAVPQSPVVKQMEHAKGWGDAWDAFSRDPLTYIGNMSLESAPQSAVSMIGAIAAARAGGSAGATARIAAGAGVGSGVVEYASALVEGMQQNGVNAQDPAAIQAATQDPELWARVEQHAATRAGIVGAFDAATMGVAGKTIAPAILTGKARQLANVPAQAVVQGAGGAAGEAAATVATGGEITPHALAGEFFGEFGTAPVDVATAAFGKDQATTNDQPPAPAPVVEPAPAASAIPTPTEAAVPFSVSSEWQAVPDGTQLPPGSEVRIDPATGGMWARVRPTAQAEEPATTAASLDAMLKDPRPAEQVQAEQVQQRQQLASDEEARSLQAFGLEKGARVIMGYGAVTAPVTLEEAWEEDGAAWARLIDADGTTYVVSPGEATFSPLVGDGTRASPVDARDAAHIEVAAAKTNPEPTPAQKEAGNYAKGHVKVHGLDIAIENAKGSTRAGVGTDGKPWSVQMPANYGYIKRTTGADGDHVDVYLGPTLDSDKVFVIDQIDAETGEFDEHKVLIGFTDADAIPTYMDAFNDGRGLERAGAVTPMSVAEFREWLHKGDTKKPLAYKKPEVPKVAPVEETTDWADVPTESAATEGSGASSPASADQQPGEVRVEPAPAAPSPDVEAVKESLTTAGPTKSDLDKLTIPNMTDVQLLAVPGLYGADHKRTKAAEREIKRRAVALEKGEPAQAAPEKGGVSVWADEIGDAYKAGGYPAAKSKFAEIETRENLTTAVSAVLADKAKDRMKDAGWDGKTGPSLEVVYVTDKPKQESAANRSESPNSSTLAKGAETAPMPKQSETGPSWGDVQKALGAKPWNITQNDELEKIAREAARELFGKRGEAFASLSGPERQQVLDRAVALKAEKQNAYERALELVKENDGLTNVTMLADKLGLSKGQAITMFNRLKREGKASDRKVVGKNGDGELVYQDVNGVRSLGDGSTRTVENVRVTPQGPVLDIANRQDRFKTADELAPATPEVQTPTAPAGGMMEVEAQEEPNGRGNAAPLDRAGTEALEDAPSQEVRPPAIERDAGPRADERGANDVRRDEGMGAPGGEPRGSVAGGEGAVAPAEGRARGARGEVAADAGARGDSRGEPDVAGQLSPRNYTITDADKLGQGGQTTKYRDNIAAIRLIRQLETEKRQATPEEQGVLARYVGWGGIKNAFPDSAGKFLNEEWAKRGAELRELLTADEYGAAMRTVLDAHYTSETVVKGIFQAVKHLGFAHGAVLEPSMGTGNFFGLMPGELRGKSQLTGVEFDHITGAIAKHLYPQANILAPMGFQEAPLADGHFDLAIGNPPFGVQGVPGAKEKDIKAFSIHNYFFARTVNKMRPGGVMAMVVTSRYLDKPGERERAYVAHRAEFLGAIRLPNTAFKQNALTEVVTDIVFLKKLPEAKWGTADKAWLETTEIPVEGGTATVNRYFADNPAMVLGKPALTGTMYRANEFTVEADGRDLGEALAEAVKHLPAGAYDASTTARPTVEMVKQSAEAAPLAAEHDIGSYFTDGERLMRREESPDGSMVAVELTAATQWTEKTTLGDTRFARIKGMVGVRDAARVLLRLEASDATDAQVTRARSKLNKVYDAFVAEHGYLNDRANEILFKDDPDSPLVLALEKNYQPGINAAKARQLGVKAVKPSADKMEIFSKRVIPRYEPVTKADNPVDALAVTLAERGVVDIAHMAQLTGKSEEDITRTLYDERDEPLIFKNPATGAWETPAVYLSGNVKAKAREAEAVGMTRNVEALRKVFPPDRKAGDIRIRLGASWVKSQHYAAFAKHLLGDDTKASIVHIPVTGGFSVTITGGSSTANTGKWGTSAASATWLVDRMLNNKEIVIRRKGPNDTMVVDVEATEAAQAKAGEIRDEFTDWIMRDPARRAELTEFYNDVFNTNVEPKFDGSHLTLPGKVPHIKMRRHQRNAIWRGIQTSRTLLDHVVGAGKTFTIIATRMERRRMGLSKKPMIVVPNHLVDQWAQDFYTLYPGAKLLTMSKKDFQAKNRKRLLAKVATGDWDAVIIAHSSFGFIPVARERQVAFMEKQVAEIQASIDVMRREEGKEGRRVADLVRSKQNLEKKIAELLDKPKDDLLTFEELGVDDLTLDESHEFKNLFFTTARRGLLGLGNPNGSKKALDLFIKVRYMQEAGGVTEFATGTPISNSLSEKYTLQRYMGLEELESRGILSFDSWLNNFGNDYSDYELDGTGVKYKQVNRLRGLTNMIEVMAMYRQYADSVTIDDIKQAFRQENGGKEFPIPKVAGGKPRENVVIPRSEAQAAYFAEIVERASNIKRGGTDNMLNITTDARKAALDIRLVDPGAGDEPGSKTHKAADNITRIWQKWEKDRGAQLVFLDLSIPLSAAKSEGKKLSELLGKIEAAAANVAKAARRGDIAATDEAEAELEALQEKLAKDYTEDDITAVKAAERGFSVYDDLKQKLIDRGIPANEIAFIHDANTDDRKADLFAQVNAGKVRVLLGSTSKMGAGTNVQKRLVGLHHIDCPWRPSDIEQREGRIVRQGNELLEKYGDQFEVEVLAYATEQTYDARMWQTQEQKLIGIEGLRNYNGDIEMEEVAAASASAAEMKAAATGNPLILEDVQLAEAVRKLESQKKAHNRSQYDLEDNQRRYTTLLKEGPERLRSLKADAVTAKAYLSDPFAGKPPTGTVDGKEYSTLAEAREAAQESYEAQTAGADDGERVKYSVVINGKACTSQEAIAMELAKGWGDSDPVTIELGGKEFHSRRLAAELIRAKGELTGKVGGFAVEIEVTQPEKMGGGDFGSAVNIVVKGEREYHDSRTSYAKKPEDAHRTSAQRAVDLILAAIRDIQGEIDSIENRMARARKELPEIEKELGKGWPKESELAEKKARHADVRKALTAKPEEKAADAPAASPPEKSLKTDEPAFRLVASDGFTEKVPFLEKALRAELDKMGLADVGLKLVSEITMTDDQTGAPAGRADATYWRKLVTIALDAKDKTLALRHEAVHALRRLSLFTKAEWATLERMARDTWMSEHKVAANWPSLDIEGQLEEAVAEAYAAWKGGKGTSTAGMAGRAFAKLDRFVRAVGNALRGQGFQTWEDVFERAESGTVGSRPRAEVETAAEEAHKFLIRRPPPPTGPVVPGETGGLMPDAGWMKRTFIHPRTIAAIHKAFVPVYRTAERQFEARDEVAAGLSRLIEPYMALSPESKHKVNAVLELGRLQGTVVRNNQLLAVANTGHPHARLTSLGEVIRMNQAEQDAYKAVRGAMDRALELFKRQVIAERGVDPATANTATAIEALAQASTDPAEQARLMELAQTVREIEQAKRQGYVPFQRWGQVGIVVKKDAGVDPTTGEIVKETVYFEAIEVDGLIERAGRWIDKKLGRAPNFNTMPKVVEALNRVKDKFQALPDHDIKVFQIPPKAPMAASVGLADLDMLAQVAQIDTQTWDSVRDAFDTAIQARGFRSHFFGAKNIPGYSGDFERAIADYVVGISGYLARRQFTRSWDDAIKAVPRNQPSLAKYAQEYRDYVQSPAEEFFVMRQLGFVYYLGGSIATAIVNMTQVPIITGPYLTQFHGKTGVARELARAYKDALKMLTRKKGMDLFDPAKAPADMAAALQTAWDEGYFVPLNTWEVMGLAHNRTPALRGLSKKARTAVDFIAILFTMAERLNRLVTFIAAHRLARNPQVQANARRVLAGNALARSGELMRGFTPEKFAEWVIDETHYRMGKINRPKVLRGVGSWIGQFKGFMMQTLELMWRLSSQNGKEGKKAFLMIAALLFVTSGIWGEPFADDITDLMEFLHKTTKGTDFDIRTEFREAVVELTSSPKLAEALAKGGPRALGVDLSRIGMGNIVPNDLQEAGGIPWSLTLGRLSQAIEHGKHGDGALAAAELLPTFAKNLITGMVWGTDGVRSQTTGRKVITAKEVTAGQMLLKSIGFTPGEIANRRESEFAQNRANKASADVKAAFYGRFSRLFADESMASETGDTDRLKEIAGELAEAYDDLNAFNEGRPDHEQVKLDNKTMQAKVAEELQGAKARDKRSPKAARSRRQAIDTIYGTTD
jgi:N12 class adenine-specific DNA methylase/predicted RNA methylase